MKQRGSLFEIVGGMLVKFVVLLSSMCLAAAEHVAEQPSPANLLQKHDDAKVMLQAASRRFWAPDQNVVEGVSKLRQLIADTKNEMADLTKDVAEVSERVKKLKADQAKEKETTETKATAFHISHHRRQRRRSDDDILVRQLRGRSAKLVHGQALSMANNAKTDDDETEVDELATEESDAELQNKDEEEAEADVDTERDENGDESEDDERVDDDSESQEGSADGDDEEDMTERSDDEADNRGSEEDEDDRSATETESREDDADAQDEDE